MYERKDFAAFCKAEFSRKGVIAVVSADFLQPNNNKQSFQDDSADLHGKFKEFVEMKVKQYHEEVVDPLGGVTVEDVASQGANLTDVTGWIRCDNHTCEKWRRCPQAMVNAYALAGAEWYCDDHPELKQHRNPCTVTRAIDEQVTDEIIVAARDKRASTAQANGFKRERSEEKDTAPGPSIKKRNTGGKAGTSRFATQSTPPSGSGVIKPKANNNKRMSKLSAQPSTVAKVTAVKRTAKEVRAQHTDSPKNVQQLTAGEEEEAAWKANELRKSLMDSDTDNEDAPDIDKYIFDGDCEDISVDLPRP
jgi:hypothetical protein